jgi:hypothetical protein
MFENILAKVIRDEPGCVIKFKKIVSTFTEKDLKKIVLQVKNSLLLKLSLLAKSCNLFLK